jgi:hypothetical protein
VGYNEACSVTGPWGCTSCQVVCGGLGLHCLECMIIRHAQTCQKPGCGSLCWVVACTASICVPQSCVGTAVATAAFVPTHVARGWCGQMVLAQPFVHPARWLYRVQYNQCTIRHGLKVAQWGAMHAVHRCIHTSTVVGSTARVLKHASSRWHMPCMDYSGTLSMRLK